MRLDNERPSDNIEDRRGAGGPTGGGGGFGFPRGGGTGMNLPLGRGGFSFRTIIVLVLIYFALKFFVGIDLLDVINGNQQNTGTNTQITVPGGNIDTAGGGGAGNDQTTTTTTKDAGRDFVARVLGSTERVWGSIFKNMGKTYEDPKLVLFDNLVQSACGTAKTATGPFYCPGDHKVYIDLTFYQDMKDKLGAPGDFAQAYVVAHEVGHHVQTLLGITEQVNARRAQGTEAESNELSVRVELQADCLAGVWAQQADSTAHILEKGDLEEALNAAQQIGDDRLQKRSQGYVVPESFTHGTSEQRARWLKRGFEAKDINDCDTFSAATL